MFGLRSNPFKMGKVISALRQYKVIELLIVLYK